MKRTTTTITSMAIALSLTVMPLAACSSKAADDGAASTPAEEAQAAAVTPTAEDIASWKTLGEALAFHSDDSNNWGSDENYFVTVFNAGDAVIRAVAKMTPEIYNKTCELDIMAEDYDKQLLATIGDCELVSAEDITEEKLSQGELDSFVGKTGQDLVDAGFVFESYFMYGGEQTGATFAKDNFSYNVIFDVTVEEDKTEDGGASVMGATTSSLEYCSTANAAIDPTAVA